MRIRAVAIAAAVTMTVAGVAATPAAAATTHTFAGNKAKARAEAHRLLRKGGVPHGSTRLSHRPKGLSGPVGGVPAGVRVELTRYYRVPLGARAARVWIRHHRPSGLRRDGSGSSGRNGKTIEFGYDFDSPRSTMAWTDGSLAYTVHVGRKHTLWRIDSIVLPYNPRPLRDIRSGRGLAVSSMCPKHDRHAQHVGRLVSGPQRSLAPQGRVTGALVCGYAGLDPRHGKRFTRVVNRSVGMSKAATLRTLARRVSLAHLDQGPIPCPLDDESVVVVALQYSTGRTVDLWYEPTGCGFVANGAVRANGTSPRGYGRLTRELDRVAKVSKWAWPRA